MLSCTFLRFYCFKSTLKKKKKSCDRCSGFVLTVISFQLCVTSPEIWDQFKIVGAGSTYRAVVPACEGSRPNGYLIPANLDESNPWTPQKIFPRSLRSLAQGFAKEFIIQKHVYVAVQSRLHQYVGVIAIATV